MAEHEFQKGSDPAGPEAASEGGTDEFTLYRERPIPLDGSVLWVLRGGRVPPSWGDAYPPFITEAALRAMADHVAEASRDAQAAPLGFLVGELCRCPETNARYLVVESAIPSPQPAQNDQTLKAIGRSWPRLQELLRRDRRHLLGWYHVHPDGDLTPTASDVAAHARHFPQPWQLAVVIRGDAGTPSAMVWRPEPDRPRDLRPIPFYEMMGRQGVRGGGRVVRHLDWVGYRAELPPDRTPRASADGPAEGSRRRRRDKPGPAEAPGSARVIMPDELDEAMAAEQGDAGPLFRPVDRPARGRFGMRSVIVAAVIVLALGVLAVWKRGPAPGPGAKPAPATTGASPAVVDPGHARLDRLSEATARAVTGYRERARLFDNNQMTCTDLGRGLVSVEDAWTAYNADGRARVDELTADEATRDTGLAGDVQSVERHFEASGCPRP